MPQKAYEFRHLVSFEETNLLGNVYFTHYVRWQGLCRESFLREHAPQVLREFQEGLRLATTRVSCDYYAELQALDEVLIRMTLEDVTQSEITMNFDYYRRREKLELVARGRQKVACLKKGPGGSTPVQVPEPLRRAFAPYANQVAKS